MKSLIFKKVQRAKSVILDGQHLFLKECAKCGGDFYGTEKRTRCDECAGKKLRPEAIVETGQRGNDGQPVEEGEIAAEN